MSNGRGGGLRHVPAKEIGQTDSHATPEEGKRGMEIGVLGSCAKVLKLALEDDGNNDTVDGHGLAENDTAPHIRTKISAYVYGGRGRRKEQSDSHQLN